MRTDYTRPEVDPWWETAEEATDYEPFDLDEEQDR